MALLKRGLLKGGRGRLHTGNDIIFSISVGNQKVFKKNRLTFSAPFNNAIHKGCGRLCFQVVIIFDHSPF